MKYLLFLTFFIVLNIANVYGQNCFTILVGKNASTDGSVFIAHSEDDLNDHNYVDLQKVPRIKHKAGEKQLFINDKGSIDEVVETFGYFWIAGSKYVEDQFLNEWGVAITSNSSQSKVLNGNGKIDHNLRKIVIERARTAREAVKIAGMIVEEYGYVNSGRVYSIADPNEAWVFEIANGKHWIARRVPDDEMVIIPNYYVIDDFNKTDTINYLSSPDIIDYAIANGWYNPQTDKSFNFRKIYGHSNRNDAIWNIARKWVILNMFSEKQYKFYDDFPFSVKPKQKISIPTLITALQNHYENTEFGHNPLFNNGSPHKRTSLGVKDTMTVCNYYTDFSCITQLRSLLPGEVGNIVWIAPRYPCIQPFIPWYYGIDRISSNYGSGIYNDATDIYNDKNINFIEKYPDLSCWIFDDFANKMDSCYGKEIKAVSEWKNGFQADIFKDVEIQEKELLNIYKSDHEKAVKMLTDLSNGFAEKVLIETKEKLQKMKAISR